MNIDKFNAFRKNAIYNKGAGTVTITFDAYLRMHRDSLNIHLMKVSYKQAGVEGMMPLFLDLSSDTEAGVGYTLAQPPMIDVEAISYLYGIPIEEAEKLMEG